MGNQSRPAKLGQRPEASLAWRAGNCPREAETARSKAVRLSPEINPRGEPSLLSGAGALSGRSTLGPKGPVRSRRGRRTGRMITRVPRELGRPRRLHRTCRPESRLTNSRMIRGPTSGAVGDEQRTQRWYRQAKETKCGETGGGESEHAVLPVSRGNRTSGTPRREGRAASWTRGRGARGGHRASQHV